MLQIWCHNALNHRIVDGCGIQTTDDINRIPGFAPGMEDEVMRDIQARLLPLGLP